MQIFQKEITLPPKPRGFHLVTQEITTQLPELSKLKTGVIHLFIQHTSCSLTVNENADPTVRADMKAYFDRIAPENDPHYTHTLEGSDDMPAHLKSVLLDTNLTLPITDGRLALGTWQGIYLCEHRNRGGSRRLIATLMGA